MEKMKSYFKSTRILQDIIWGLVIIMLGYYTLRMHKLNEQLERQITHIEEAR